ncbi:MAG: 5'-nucleotidase C-terminal domain-containing protein [Anaerovoracaceae bacterium]
MKSRNKRVLSIILSLVLILGLTATTGVFADKSEVVKLTVVHVNDIHGRVEEGDYDGMGFAKMMTKVKELREENPNLLLLNAGDTIHGLPIVTVSKGEVMIELMNKAGFDAMAPGNHDFNYGYDRLLELQKKAKFPILAANIVKADGTKDFQAYVIKETGGVKVGIFGLATPETKYKANPKYTEGVDFENPLESAKAMVKILKGKADIIIALAHIGDDEDANPSSLEIAEKVDGIDLLVDGHSHSKYPEGVLVNGTLLVQAEDYLKNLGIVNIEVKGGKIVKKEAKLFTKEESKEIEADEEMAALVDGFKEVNKAVTDYVIGKTKVRLDGEREIARAGESNMGNLIADALLNATGAEAAIVNGGGIRTSIEAGEITREQILALSPFGNYGVLLALTGGDLLAAVENGVAVYPDTFGGFPQVSGMTFKVDPNKPAGQRVVELKVQGQAVVKDRVYKIATNDFMAAGGDKYVSFLNAELLGEYEALEEIISDYITELGEVDIKAEGRIVYEKLKEEVTKGEFYTVKPGDVLWKIAQKYGKTWQEFAEFNKLKNPDLIFPRQVLFVPVR